jgi:hypothetical protein
MRKRLLAGAIMFFSSFLACLGQGAATWMVPASMTAEATIENRPVVCYVKETSVYYVTIEKGLNAATSGQTVVVIPGTNPVIKANCIIKSGVTLTIPSIETATTLRAFDTVSTDSATYFNAINDETGATFADDTAADVTKNRKNQVVLGDPSSSTDSVTLTVNGTLNIAGTVGHAGTTTSGQTSGEYAEIAMDSNASITVNSGAVVNCFGYIKELTQNNGSSFRSLSGSTVNEPFVIYDFAGGQETCGRYLGNKTIGAFDVLSPITVTEGKICPFEIIDLPNIQVQFTIDYNSSLIGVLDLYASDEHHSAALGVIGTASTNLIQMTSGSFSCKYHPKTFGYSSPASNSDTTFTSFIVNGGTIASLNSINFKMAVSIVTAIIDTSVVKFPISYRFDIEVCSGASVTFLNAVKVMPGCDIVVDQGGTLTANKSTVFYRGFTDSTSKTYPYPNNYHDATLLVNGTLNLNGGFGGFITTTASGAEINLGSAFSNSASDEEGKGTGAKNGSPSYVFTYTTLITESEQAKAYVGSPSTEVQLDLSSYSSYTSVGTYWNGVVDDTSVSIQSSGTATSAGAAGSFTLTAVYSSSNYSVVSYKWEILSGEGGTLSSTTSNATTLSLTANSSTDADVKVTVQLTIVDTKKARSASQTYTRTKDTGGCFVEGSLITMSDGSQKAVQDLVFGDYVKTWSFENGCYETQMVMLAEKIEPHKQEVITISLSNGESIGVTWQQDFFDVDAKKYFTVSSATADSCLGKNVFVATNDGVGSAKITSVRVSYEDVASYEIETTINYNVIANGILTVGPVIVNANIFEVNESFKWDEQKKAEDIAKYGLFTYEDFSAYPFISEDLFNGYNAKYFKVAIGKGEFTFDELIAAVRQYFPVS